jgi:mannose-6-phosphate isomerase-like protein (cupin superfamily)
MRRCSGSPFNIDDMIGDHEERPWGSWTVLDEGAGYKVKRILVLPHSRLSYQTHEHRSEHWVVVSGKATCILDGEESVAGPGDCVDVAIGQKHRICNAEDEDLHIVEVQRGDYCGEDDICRHEDDYDRA